MLYDVTIIGGGITGCAIARELMRYKVRAILVEKECEVGFGTSKTNSGIIHGGHHASPDTVKGSLEWKGNQRWDQLRDELGFGFHRCGELTVAFQEDQFETLDKLERYAEAKGVTGIERWDQARIRKEEPNLSENMLAAVFAPTTGVINPYEACFNLIDNARRNGLELSVENPVLGIARSGDCLAVQTKKKLIHTRFVINAAGVFADRIAEMAGVRDFEIRPRKGEEYMLDKRLKGLVKRVIFPCPTPVSKGILVIPTFDGTIMVGPTATHTEDRDDVSTTLEGSDQIFNSVRNMVPGISERDCIAEFAGLRAASDTEDFIIGPTSLKGFVNVAGIQSPGLTAAPAIADLVLDILRDEGLSLEEKLDFEPTIEKPVKFDSLPTEEQERLVAEDPAYARMVCRCEGITEKEILDAIHAGARTLDGIKFRTRAGMGRCQGGFCSWRCMELLSRELALPVEQITKRGGGSWVVCPEGKEVD